MERVEDVEEERERGGVETGDSSPTDEYLALIHSTFLSLLQQLVQIF